MAGVVISPNALGSNEIHVWRANPCYSESMAAEFSPLLSPEETTRAERFRFPRDRIGFIVARGFLRCILGRYLDTAPGTLAFATGPYGKPGLAGDSKKLGFNLSHSGGMLLCAVARDREVGVDVEQIHADLDWMDLARRFFCPAEVTALAALSPEQGRREFHVLWSRKEALLKGLGTGFALAPDKVELPVLPREDPYFTAVRDPAGRASCWSLWTLEMGPGYSAAVAAQGEGGELKYGHFENLA